MRWEAAGAAFVEYDDEFGDITAIATGRVGGPTEAIDFGVLTYREDETSFLIVEGAAPGNTNQAEQVLEALRREGVIEDADVLERIPSRAGPAEAFEAMYLNLALDIASLEERFAEMADRQSIGGAPPPRSTRGATPDRPKVSVLVVDAAGKRLRAVAGTAAAALKDSRGHKHQRVVVINANKVLTPLSVPAAKRNQWQSGDLGGVRSHHLEEMVSRRPEDVIRLAVKAMLPRDREAQKRLARLHVYEGSELTDMFGRAEGTVGSGPR